MWLLVGLVRDRAGSTLERETIGPRDGTPAGAFASRWGPAGPGAAGQAQRAGSGSAGRPGPAGRSLAQPFLALVDGRRPGRGRAGPARRRLVVSAQLAAVRRPAGLERLAGQHPAARRSGRLGDDPGRAAEPGAFLLGPIRLDECGLPRLGLHRCSAGWSSPIAVGLLLAADPLACPLPPAGLALGRRGAADALAGAAGHLVAALHAHRAGRAGALFLSRGVEPGAADGDGCVRLQDCPRCPRLANSVGWLVVVAPGRTQHGCAVLDHPPRLPAAARLSSAAASLPPLRADLGGQFAVLGVAAAPATVTPGDTATVTVTWQALAPGPPTIRYSSTW